MQNVQNTLNGTVQSVTNAAKEFSKIPTILRTFEGIGLQKLQIVDQKTLQDYRHLELCGIALAKIPVLFRKVESFGLSGKLIIENSADLDNYVTQLMNLDSSSQKAAQSLVVLDGSMKTSFKQDVARLQSGQKINAQLFERTLAVTELNAVQQKQIVSDAKLIDAKGRYVIAETSVVEQNILSSASFKALSTNEQAAVKQAMSHALMAIERMWRDDLEKYVIDQVFEESIMIGEYYAISRLLDGVYKWCKCGVRYNNEALILRRCVL